MVVPQPQLATLNLLQRKESALTHTSRYLSFLVSGGGGGGGSPRAAALNHIQVHWVTR